MLFCRVQFLKLILSFSFAREQEGGRAREQKIYPKKYPEIKGTRKYMRNSEEFGKEQLGRRTNNREQQQ